MDIPNVIVMGGVAASVAGVPMGLVVFLLRSIHERISAVESRLRKLDELAGTVKAMETKVRTDHATVAQMERDRRTMLVLSRHEKNAGSRALTGGNEHE